MYDFDVRTEITFSEVEPKSQTCDPGIYSWLNLKVEILLIYTNSARHSARFIVKLCWSLNEIFFPVFYIIINRFF